MENKYCFISFSLFSVLFVFQQAIVVTKSEPINDGGGVGDDDDDRNNLILLATMIHEFLFNYKHLKFGTLFLCANNDISDTVYGSKSSNNGGNLLPLITYLAMNSLTVKLHRVNDTVDTIESSDFLRLFQIRDNAEFVVVLVDEGCAGSQRLLAHASRHSLYNSTYHWLIVQRQINNCTVLTDRFQTLNINVNSEITLVCPNGESYQFFDVWNPGHERGGKLNVTLMGDYQRGKGMQIKFPGSTILRRRNMRELNLRTMNVLLPRNVVQVKLTFEEYLRTPVYTHMDTFCRYNFALISVLGEFFNLTYFNLRARSWGYKRNNTFDGMMQALILKRIDIAGSAAIFRPDRHEVISYTALTWIEAPRFIFRNLENLSSMRNIFLMPFDNLIWLLIGLSGFVITCSLYFAVCGENKYHQKLFYQAELSTFRIKRHNEKAVESQNKQLGNWKKHNKHHVDSQQQQQQQQENRLKTLVKNYFLNNSNNNAISSQLTKNNLTVIDNISKSFLTFIAAICQQGLCVELNLWSGKCLTYFTLLFGFLIYQFYSASIVGSLLMERPKLIKTLRDLIDSQLVLAIEDIPYNRDYFVRTTDPNSLEIYQRKISYCNQATGQNESNFFNATEGMMRMQREQFAFFVGEDSAYKFIADTMTDRDICGLTEIEMMEAPFQVGHLVTKNSPFRKIFTYGIRRLAENGIMDYKKKVWKQPPLKCVKEIRASDLQVEVQYIYSALMLLAIGMVASVTLMLLEILIHHLGTHIH